MMTIEQALDLRASIKEHKENRYKIEIVGAILCGNYDRYKSDSLKIAQEDVDFLTSEYLERVKAVG